MIDTNESIDSIYENIKYGEYTHFLNSKYILVDITTLPKLFSDPETDNWFIEHTSIDPDQF